MSGAFHSKNAMILLPEQLWEVYIMKRIRFAVIGGGWRTDFFVRIAKALPQQFEISSVFLRDAAKRQAWENERGIRAASSLNDLLKDSPEFLVLCITKKYIVEKLEQLLSLGIPILCETPGAVTLEGLSYLWEMLESTKCKFQIAQQYPYQPFYSAWSKAMGLIGEVSNMSISAVHTYHAIALIRHFLQAGFQKVTLCGNRFYFPVKQTDSRAGFIQNGEVTQERRDRLDFVFEGGKTAFFDFSNVQYQSFIRTRHFSLQGVRGEIDDMTIRYLNENNLPITSQLERKDLGIFQNNGWSHFGLSLNNEYLYENPFSNARLNDDELALATCLVRMSLYVNNDAECVYPIEDAMQDAYIAILMEEALTHPYTMIHSVPQPWM